MSGLAIGKFDDGEIFSYSDEVEVSEESVFGGLNSVLTILCNCSVIVRLSGSDGKACPFDGFFLFPFSFFGDPSASSCLVWK